MWISSAIALSMDRPHHLYEATRNDLRRNVLPQWTRDTAARFLGFCLENANTYRPAHSKLEPLDTTERDELLIHEIVADVDGQAGEVILVIHWKGGVQIRSNLCVFRGIAGWDN
jgi:hypothetical protein